MLKIYDILSCKQYSAAKDVMPNAEGCPVCGDHNWLYNLFPYTLGAINILPNTTMQDSNHSYDNYYYVTDNFICRLVAGFAI